MGAGDAGLLLSVLGENVTGVTGAGVEVVPGNLRIEAGAGVLLGLFLSAGLGTLRSGAAVGCWLSRICESCLRASTSLSASGASGELPNGALRVARMSWTPAPSQSREDAMGIVNLVGNKVSVSQICSWRKDQIHTR
jgi:hypothetical protein